MAHQNEFNVYSFVAQEYVQCKLKKLKPVLHWEHNYLSRSSMVLVYRIQLQATTHNQRFRWSRIEEPQIVQYTFSCSTVYCDVYTGVITPFLSTSLKYNPLVLKHRSVNPLKSKLPFLPYFLLRWAKARTVYFRGKPFFKQIKCLSRGTASPSNISESLLHGSDKPINIRVDRNVPDDGTAFYGTTPLALLVSLLHKIK